MRTVDHLGKDGGTMLERWRRLLATAMSTGALLLVITVQLAGWKWY